MGYIINNGINYFGDNTVTLTQAQYDALEQAGTVDPHATYFITDRSTGSGEYAAEVIYDNTESGLSSANVQNAVDELAANISTVTTTELATNAYYSKSGNIVQLNLTGYTVPANTGSFGDRDIIGTLPVGYRPGNVVHQPTISGTVSLLRISAEGEVSIRNSDTTAHDAFITIIFIAEN